MQKFRNPFAVNEKKEMIYIKTGDIKNKEKYKIAIAQNVVKN